MILNVRMVRERAGVLVVVVVNCVATLLINIIADHVKDQESVAMVKLSLNADFVMALASVSTIEGEVFAGIVQERVFALIIKKEHYALSAWVVLFARMVKEKINAQNVQEHKFASMGSLNMVVYNAVLLYANIATTSIVVPIAMVPKFVNLEMNLTTQDVEH